jgi:uncharacterized protein (DUF2235 family)
MPRNIVVFSDGTGQRGGLLFDENRSNVYKLYRATRCGPDSSIDPGQQLAFYDPGLGTLPPGGGSFARAWRGIYNLISQATGLGLTGNIVDCYAAIIRMWQPGDRIFLLGFSRGAYTIRCLGGVLSCCGLPTRMKDGSSLKRDEATSKRIAREAVKQVYQHTSSKKEEQASTREKELLAQRRALARRFRRQYGSGDDDAPNVYPYLIGVFDTVASLSNPVAVFGLSSIAFVVVALPLAALWLLFPWVRWWIVAAGIVAALAVLTAYLATHLKVAFGLEGHSWWRTLHLSEPRMRFYDTDLNENVGYARHAISIDECRKSFLRVRWGTPRVWRYTGEGNPSWFKQVWFAGNHSDVGGSYAENESRLSDVTLKWMAEEAESTGLQIDRSLLHTWPTAGGMEHDETKSSLFRFAGTCDRDPVDDAQLHETVIERFKIDAVLQYDVMRPYRPRCLRNHQKVSHFYEADALVAQLGGAAAAEASRKAGEARQQKDEPRAAHWERVAAEIARRA